MPKGLLWNCQKHGHSIDLDWPAETIASKNVKTGKTHVYALGRCLECGCFYSLKSEAPAMQGIISPAGKVIA